MKETLKEFGFRSFYDLFTHLFAFQNFFVVKIQVIFAFTSLILIEITGFVDANIYSPSAGLFIIWVMILIRSVTGALVSTRIKKQSFNAHKFLKTVPILIAHLGIMSLSWYIGNVNIIMEWLPIFVLAIFSTFHFFLIFKNLVELGLLEGELLTKLSKKIDNKTDML